MKALLFVFLLVIVRSVAEVEGSCGIFIPPRIEAEIKASLKYHGLMDIHNPSEYSVHETRPGGFGPFTAIVMGAHLYGRFKDEILVDKCNMTERNRPVSVVGYGEINYGGNRTKYWKIKEPVSWLSGYYRIRRGDDSNCLESQRWTTLNSQPATEAGIQASIKYNHGLADSISGCIDLRPTLIIIISSLIACLL